MILMAAEGEEEAGLTPLFGQTGGQWKRVWWTWRPRYKSSHLQGTENQFKLIELQEGENLLTYQLA